MPSHPSQPSTSVGLARHADFNKLWIGQTVSQFGSMVTGHALPLTAVLVLSADPMQMGLLAALGFAPVLLLGLVAGVWADRLRRRPILIATDLGRAVLVASIPVAALLGRLTMAHLYLVAALAGALTLFFNVAYRSYLPVLVRREHLVEGNSKLSLTESLAEVVVPSVTGVLVQVISAPLTLLFDSLSYLFSGAALGLIRAPEPPPPPAATRVSVRREIGEGLSAVMRQPLLRSPLAAEVTQTLFGSFYAALYSLYVLETLELSPAILGLLIGSGGLGALIGAAGVRAFTRRLGLGPALIWSMLVMTVLSLFIPLAGGPPWLRAAFLFVPQLFGDLFRAMYSINSLSLRQAITPDRLLGRVNASANVVEGGAGMIGMLLGGFLGQVLGIRAAVWIAALGGLLAMLWLLFSPLRTLREQPADEANEAGR